MYDVCLRKVSLKIQSLKFRHLLTQIAMFIRAKGKTVTSAGGLAATSDLAAFLVSMIALVKKSVNHLRTIASMRKTQQD